MSMTQQPSMLDAINSCSFIRVGNRIVYPGVNGNAFQFSDSPPVASARSMPDLSNIPEVEEETEEAEHNLLEPRLLGAGSRTSSSQSLAATPTATPIATPINTPAVTPTEPISMRRPPKLPPPPAAHLPPPLPSKPASGTSTSHHSLSRRSSCSSRSSSPGFTRSSRLSDRETSGSHATSGEFDYSEVDGYDQRGESYDRDSAPTTPTFYRSSGTITVATVSPTRKSSSPSPSRACSTSLPVAEGGGGAAGFGSNSIRSTLALSSAALITATCTTPPACRRAMAGKKDEGRERASSDGRERMMRGGEDRATSRREERRDESKEGYLFDGGGGGGGGGAGGLDTGRPATPDSGIDCHLDSRGYDGSPAKAKQEESSTSGRGSGNQSNNNSNSNNNKLIPLDISSLRRGTMNVADLVTSAVIGYKNRGKGVKSSSKSDSAKKSNKKTTANNEPLKEEETIKTSNISIHFQTEIEITNSTTENKHSTEMTKSTEVTKSTDMTSSAETSRRSPEARAFRGNVTKKEPEANEPTEPNTQESTFQLLHREYSTIGTLSTSVHTSWQRHAEHSSQWQKHTQEEPNSSNTSTLRPIPSRVCQTSPEISASEISETESEASTASGKSGDKKVRSKKSGTKNERKTVRSIKKAQKLKQRFEKGTKCRSCHKVFGLRNQRHHCVRCRKSYCDQCLSFGRYNVTPEECDQTILTKVCRLCREEIAHETSRGQTRGLWTDYQQMRSEAKLYKGLDVTSKADTSNKQQTIHDLTSLLRKVCVTFLVELQQQLDRSKVKQSSVSKVWENASSTKYSKVQKAKMKEVKDCSACRRQLRYLTDSRFCDVCGHIFCTVCTAKTLQLYLPVRTDLSKHLSVDVIRFHIKTDEKDEIHSFEASELYYTCLECENTADRFIKILSFNQNIPIYESEMFDLQRHIDHALTYAPPHMMGGMRKAVSTSNLTGLDSEAVDTNMKLAHRLYDRFTRAYDVLNHMEPQTAGQMLLHMHIKQAMYDFYLKRRDQLRVTLRRRGSCLQLAELPS